MNRQIYRSMGEVDAKQNRPRRKFCNDAWQSQSYNAGYDAVLQSIKTARGKPTHKRTEIEHEDTH